MQSIASNQANISRDEKLTELLSFILILPQKWKNNNEFSSKIFMNIPYNVVDKYSYILEQLFILPSDSSNVFLLLDKLTKSSDLFNIDQNSTAKTTTNYDHSAKEFILNLLYLSINFQSIYDFLLKFVSCKSPCFISFFEKNDFSDLLIDFLFHEDLFTNKKLFNQNAHLIECLLSNIQIDSRLFSVFFKTYDNLNNKMNNFQFDSNFSHAYINYETNILHILDISLCNDSYFGINLVLSIHFRLSISNRFSLHSINHPETIEKLYRFLGQKINNKQFDKSAVSTILLLTSIMNNVFHQKNNFFNLLKKDLPVSELESKNINYQFQNENHNERDYDMEFLSQLLSDLQLLYKYDEKANEDIGNYGNSKEIISTFSEPKNQPTSNNEVLFSGIPPPIYQDGGNNDLIIQRPNSYSPMSNHKSKRNSRFYPMINKQRKDPHKGFSKLAQCDPNCLSLGAIQDEKSIVPLFPSPYKTYQQFDVCTNAFYSQQKINNKTKSENKNEMSNEKDQNETEIKKESNQTNNEFRKENDINMIELNEENDQNKNEISKETDQNETEISNESHQTNEELNKSNNQNLIDQNKTEEIPINITNENKNDNETYYDSKEEQSDHIDNINNKKRIIGTNLKEKDIQELVNSTNTTNNIELNEIRTRKRTPLIPAIPTKQNQPKAPGRLRSLSSLNNIYGSNSSVHSYEQVENELNSGYSSNYYKASISSSRSFGNVLQTSNSKSNFTVTTGLGTHNRSLSPQNGFGIKKRNSYGFISPLKPLYGNSQSDITNDHFVTNNTNIIHASHSASQYDDDVFPTTFVESVMPEYAKEVNFGKNSEQKNQSNIESGEINVDENNGKDSVDNQINDNVVNNIENGIASSDSNEIDSTINEERINNDIINNDSPSTDDKDKSDSLSGIDSSPDYYDNMDATPTPRGTRRLNSKKRPNSGDYIRVKRQKKARTSLPPSGIKFNKPKDDNEISLIDLATSSEAINLDDFNIDMGRRMSQFAMNKDRLIHSTSGPISRSNYSAFASPFRKSLGSISIQKSPLGSASCSQNDSTNDLINIKEEGSKNAVKLQEFGRKKPPLSPMQLINEEDGAQQNNSLSLDLISENADENCHQISSLPTIKEEASDNMLKHSSMLDTISEDDENQQKHAFPLLKIISEESEESNQSQLLETIKEEDSEPNLQTSQLQTIEENQQSLETIAEEDEENPQLLDTITEETEENQQTSQLEAITEENEESPQLLDTITEEVDKNHQSLETITEENEENPQFLNTITEEAEENQQTSQLDTITEENEDNPQLLDTITEEDEENQQITPLDTITEENEESPQLLDTITEEDEENQHTTQLKTNTEEDEAIPQLLDTITEEAEENQQTAPLETISEEIYANQPLLEAIEEEPDENQQQISPLEAITEEDEENPRVLHTITEEADEKQNHQSLQLETIAEDDEQRQQVSPLEAIDEEVEENRSTLETITEEDEENPQLIHVIPEEEEESQQQQQAPSLETIDENQQQHMPLLDAIAEEDEENKQQQQKAPSLETITEESKTTDHHSQLLETISEEADENQQQQIPSLFTIAEDDEENQQQQQTPSLETISEERNENQQQRMQSLFTIAEDDEENQQQQIPSLFTIAEDNEENQQQHEIPSLFTIAEDNEENQQQHPSPSQETITEEPNSPKEAENASHITVRQIESNLFVSIGVLLANELFIENTSCLFQNSICIYLNSLDSCDGLFEKVMTESNLVMQVINSEKESRIRTENEQNIENGFDDEDDDNESVFGFDYHENMKDDFERIPIISKIINNNHDSIPLEFKNQWNEYMDSFIKKDEEQKQINGQNISSCSQLD